MCAFNTDKQLMKHLSHLRFVSHTADFLCTNLYEFFIHVIFYVIKHDIFVSFSFMSYILFLEV